MPHGLADLAFNMILNIVIHCLEFGPCNRESECMNVHPDCKTKNIFVQIATVYFLYVCVLCYCLYQSPIPKKEHVEK